MKTKKTIRNIALALVAFAMFISFNIAHASEMGGLVGAAINNINPEEPGALGEIINENMVLQPFLDEGLITEDEFNSFKDKLKDLANQWLDHEMTSMDPTNPGELKNYLDLQAILDADLWGAEEFWSEDKDHAHAAIRHSASKWLKNMVDNLDPDSPDFKPFSDLLLLQTTDFWEEKFSAEARAYKEEQLHKKMDEWLINQAKNASTLEDLEMLRMLQNASFFGFDFENLFGKEAREYKEKMLKEKFALWLDKELDDESVHLPELADVARNYCPPLPRAVCERLAAGDVADVREYLKDHKQGIFSRFVGFVKGIFVDPVPVDIDTPTGEEDEVLDTKMTHIDRFMEPKFDTKLPLVVSGPTCGNGVVDSTELCDYKATPTGCGEGEICAANCTCKNLEGLKNHSLIQLISQKGLGDAGDWKMDWGSGDHTLNFQDVVVKDSDADEGKPVKAEDESTLVRTINWQLPVNLICGDGMINGDEQCDYKAFPNGCIGDTFCNSNCECSESDAILQAKQYLLQKLEEELIESSGEAPEMAGLTTQMTPDAQCGDGKGDEGEECDFKAFSTGCLAFKFCSNSCKCIDYVHTSRYIDQPVRVLPLQKIYSTGASLGLRYFKPEDDIRISGPPDTSQPLKEELESSPTTKKRYFYFTWPEGVYEEIPPEDVDKYDPERIWIYHPDCGNYKKDAGEECDYLSIPSDCKEDQFCSTNCVCENKADYVWASPSGGPMIIIEGLEESTESYDPDNPACGDGDKSPDEGCDPNAEPTGCNEPKEYCDVFTCQCVQLTPRCGDGWIYRPPNYGQPGVGGEECDPKADPNGCPEEFTCTDKCKCEKKPDEKPSDYVLADAIKFILITPPEELFDEDEDNIPDFLDNCPSGPNTEQEDLDNDGFGDVCDADDDGDNVPDKEDNCPGNPNPDQEDEDKDGLGDVCDAPSLVPAEAVKPEQIEVLFEERLEGEDTELPGSFSPDKETPPSIPLAPGGEEEEEEEMPSPFSPDKEEPPMAPTDLPGPESYEPVEAGPGWAPDEPPEDPEELEKWKEMQEGRLPPPPPPEPEETVKKDFDKDGTSDTEDNCAAVFNPDQLDSDGDGKGDACDRTPYPPEPESIPELEPIPPLYPYPEEPEEPDDSGLIMPWGPSEPEEPPLPPEQEPTHPEEPPPPPPEPDSDGDGFLDIDDNCPFMPNPDQMDSDGNGIGDICDAPPPPPPESVDVIVPEPPPVDLIIPDSEPPPPEPDMDGDGFLDIDDNCPDLPNPDQMDSDGNGLGDACDIPPDPATDLTF